MYVSLRSASLSLSARDACQDPLNKSLHVQYNYTLYVVAYSCLADCPSRPGPVKLSCCCGALQHAWANASFSTRALPARYL